MVKPAAHDSFYKCSTHFSLILVIIINNYIIIFYILHFFYNPSAGKGRQA
jgi:hypothetical protein